MTRRSQLRSHTPIRSHARKPRPAVVKDPAYLAFIHEQACMILYDPERRGECCGRTEAHHDRPHGSVKNDRRTVPLCAAHHRETPFSVHGGGGHWKFAERYGISFEAEISRLNRLYEAEKGAAA
jgi:hypothetical protein